MVDLPRGTVTFLFTDVEGSTRLWEESPDPMMAALALHDDVIEAAAAGHGGVVVKPRGEGDSRFLVFPSAVDAVASAIEVQRNLDAVDWPTPRPLLVRIALHTGVAELESGDYYGSAVNRAARLRSIGHGGQTLISRATWDLVRDDLPSGAEIRDMGRHRLKDLARPEHVYQVDITGHNRTFPPLKSLDAVPNNLPEQLTEFVGRADDLAKAKELLSKGRLVTILGPGGVGKSRLAIQVGADLATAYQHGVFFVSLAPIDSMDDIVPAIAAALGIPLASEQDLLDQLLAYLRLKQQLLILDNLEHLEGAAAMVAEILRAASNVSVLATSRTRLNVSGETALVLSGLDYRWSDLEDALQCDAVQLFIDAAERKRPGFAVDASDLTDLGTILGVVQGMPLGILLAAAWLDMMTLDEIATEIRDSLDLLETDLTDMPDRHRSIEAVFEYSWRLLGEAERELFVALSVFRGGFDREACKAVAGASVRDLARLVNKSLIVAEPEARRYSVHELLRQYAEAKLEEDGSAVGRLRDRHAAYYGTLMSRAYDDFRAGDEPAALSVMEDDLDNVRTAWRHLVATRSASEARGFVESLWILYEVRGWYLSGKTLFNDAADAFEGVAISSGPGGTWALCTAAASWFSALLGAPADGLTQVNAAVESLEEENLEKELALALMMRNLSLIFTDVESLRANADAALDVSRRSSDEWLTNLLTTWRASCAVMQGDTETAQRLGDQARRNLGEVGHQWVRNWSYQALSGAARFESRFEDAAVLLEQALTVSYEIDFKRGIQYALNNLGVVSGLLGRDDEAETYFLRSLAISAEIGQTREILHTMCDIAEVRARNGAEEQALTLIAAALANPASSQLSVYRAPIDEQAIELKTRLEEAVDSAAFREAWERGRTTSIEPLVEELLSLLPTS